MANPNTLPVSAIASRAEAEALLTELTAAADELAAAMGKETELLRAGKLDDAAALMARKAAAAANFTRLSTAAKREAAALDRFAPAATLALRRRQTAFRADIRTNLAVVATARDVAEGLLRAVAASMGQGTAPSTYGARGAGPAPAVAARGLAVDRSL